MWKLTKNNLRLIIPSTEKKYKTPFDGEADFSHYCGTHFKNAKLEVADLCIINIAVWTSQHNEVSSKLWSNHIQRFGSSGSCVFIIFFT